MKSTNRLLSAVTATLLLFCHVHVTSAASVVGSNPGNVNIPDAGAYVSSTIAISTAPAGAVVTGIDVYFKCTHTYSGDLVVDLNADSTGSLGNRNLWNREGAGADNPTRTTPGIPTFNGLSVNRTWYLYAKDFAVGDSGYIDEWTITVYYSNPTTYTITPNPAAVSENVGMLTFTITRAGGTPAEVIYASTTQTEGYANNNDYTGFVNQAVNFAAGQLNQNVTVTIINDATVEANEIFGLIVQRNSSDPIGTYLAKRTFTILNDDDAGTGSMMLPGSIGYIRQINNSDMHPAFDSASACGPCSAVMILTYYDRLTPHPMIGQSGQNNDFSWYVAPVAGGSPSSTAYSVNGFPFNVGTPDVAGGAINYGGSGYLTQDFPSDPQTRADRAVQYLWKHGLFATFASAATEADVRAEIDAGRPVFLSAEFATGGHIMVIRGYNQIQLIAADPWVRSDGLNRDQHAYTWSEIHYGGMPKWVVKTITPIEAGGRVRAATTFNVRLQPDTSAGTAGGQRTAGQLGTVVSDATLNSTFWNADGYTWAKVQWDDQVVGWSAIGSGDSLWIEPIFEDSNAPASPQITNSRISGSTFTLSVTSQTGFIYTLERKNSLNDSTWNPRQTKSGTGEVIDLLDTEATGISHIYQVRAHK